MKRSIPFLLACLLLGVSGVARGDDYYAIVFGAESKPQRPKYSHSWATFMRVPSAGPFEVVTISWLPTAIELHPNRLRAEPGANFDLPTTLQIVMSHCEEVAAWGPYRIECELFCRAQRQSCRLASGEVKYKTIDFLRNSQRVSNCIHALTVINPENRRLRIGRTNFGDVASYYVADSYRPWMICPHEIECWVLNLLDLQQYPIKWRTLDQGRPRADD
jgi:hypothetical protein